MKEAKEVIPWKVTDISIRPYDGMWSFNPSVHYDGQVWRCVLRCCDYAMPNGVTIRGKKSGPGHQTKNVMVVLDPQTWRPISVHKMHERDDQPRVPCANVGYEDMRIFRTDQGGLQGIAASLHLERGTRTAGGSKNQPPEQVLLSFDDEYNIVRARPIRGDWWGGTPQKNWVPFDHCAEPRFLYSIDKGTMFGDRGALHGSDATARPSAATCMAVPIVVPVVVAPPSPAPVAVQAAPVKERDDRPRERPDARRSVVRGGDVQLVRGRRVAADTLSTRPSALPSARPSTNGRFVIRSSSDSSRMIGTGRALPPKYPGLRGGTQLQRVGADAWLGMGHEMRYDKGKKLYWHTWYVVDGRGKLTAASAPMKLVPNGIEFAAGMAIDGDRIVVSFGVDDMECKIGETRLGAVMEVLQPVAR